MSAWGLPASFGLAPTPSPFGPWHPAQDLAFAAPAAASPAACATCIVPSAAIAAATSNALFMSLLLLEVSFSPRGDRHVDHRARPLARIPGGERVDVLLAERTRHRRH